MTRHLVRTSSPTPRPAPAGAGSGLPCRVRLADGRLVDGPLAPERHRAIQLGMLHAARDGLGQPPPRPPARDGLVELPPGTRAPDGSLAIDRRARPEHYLPGGARGHAGWLGDLLEH